MSFESGFKGNNVALIVEEGKVKRGVMKFSSNGDSIHISLSEMEYYYQISLIEENILEVCDLASEKVIQFEVLGSGALSKKQPEKVITDEPDQENEDDDSQIST